jgi:hypothetical protein
MYVLELGNYLKYLNLYHLNKKIIKKNSKISLDPVTHPGPYSYVDS